MGLDEAIATLMRRTLSRTSANRRIC
jgi:hypothetical protein